MVDETVMGVVSLVMELAKGEGGTRVAAVAVVGVVNMVDCGGSCIWGGNRRGLNIVVGVVAVCKGGRERKLWLGW